MYSSILYISLYFHVIHLHVALVIILLVSKMDHGPTCPHIRRPREVRPNFITCSSLISCCSTVQHWQRAFSWHSNGHNGGSGALGNVLITAAAQFSGVIFFEPPKKMQILVKSKARISDHLLFYLFRGFYSAKACSPPLLNQKTNHCFRDETLWCPIVLPLQTEEHGQIMFIL